MTISDAVESTMSRTKNALHPDRYVFLSQDQYRAALTDVANQVSGRMESAEEALRKIATEVGDFRQTDNDALVEIERIIEKWINE